MIVDLCAQKTLTLRHFVLVSANGHCSQLHKLYQHAADGFPETSFLEFKSPGLFGKAQGQ